MNKYEELVIKLKRIEKELEILTIKKRKVDKENILLKKQLRILKLKIKKNAPID